MQAVMLVMIITQTMCKKTMVTREQTNKTEQEAKVASATGIMKMERMASDLRVPTASDPSRAGSNPGVGN